MNPQEIQDKTAHQFRLAEAELAVLKRELVLQQLLDTRALGKFAEGCGREMMLLHCTVEF